MMEGVLFCVIGLFSATLHWNGIVVDAERAGRRTHVDAFTITADSVHHSRTFTERELNGSRPPWSEKISSYQSQTGCASGCIMEMMYQQDLHFGRRLNNYSYSRLIKCLQRNETLSELLKDVNVDRLLTLHEPYFPELADDFPEYSELTIEEAYRSQGLVHLSLAPEKMKLVNRLPFIEHVMRTGEEWTTSSPQVALQVLHLITDILSKLGLPDIGERKRVAVAGCGTGFLTALLAMICTGCEEVVGMEYLQSLNVASKQIAERGGVYEAHPLRRGWDDGIPFDEQAVLGKISWSWADAMKMQDLSNGETLGTFDFILFGVSLPHGTVPHVIVDAVKEDGLLVGPQCEPPPHGNHRKNSGEPFKKPVSLEPSEGSQLNNEARVMKNWREETLYCVGKFRIYQKRQGTLHEIDMAQEYVIPSFFMIPFRSAAAGVHSLLRAFLPWFCLLFVASYE